MENYTKSDMDRLEAEIRKAMPEAKIERWRDFGFAMDVSIGSRACVACQPPSSWQDGCFHDVEEIKHLLTEH